jgi:hypothetical protein
MAFWLQKQSLWTKSEEACILISAVLFIQHAWDLIALLSASNQNKQSILTADRHACIKRALSIHSDCSDSVCQNALEI